MASSKDEIETETHNNNETNKSSNLEDTQKQRKFYQKIGDYITEKKDGIFEKIDIV